MQSNTDIHVGWHDSQFSLTSDRITLSGSECLRSSRLLRVRMRCCGDTCCCVTFTPLKSPLQRRRTFSSRFCFSSVRSTGAQSTALRRNGWSRRKPPGPSAGLRRSALNNHSEKISRARRRRWADGEFEDKSSRSSSSCTNNLLLAEPVHCNDNSSEKPASPTDSCHGKLSPRDGGVNTGVEMLWERDGRPSFILCASELPRSVAHIDDAAFHRAENIAPLLIRFIHRDKKQQLLTQTNIMLWLWHVKRFHLSVNNTKCWTISQQLKDVHNTDKILMTKHTWCCHNFGYWFDLRLRFTVRLLTGTVVCLT